ncbi:MAG: nickel pincer cofactor biosynthesis protein LarC [Nitrospiraceae bacterium]|nr:nickel pincer cofactor biosynthesis protein LarC [Nitrospiraceae bacterium]
MKTAYLNCDSGISGDMCLAALVDAGVHPDRLSEGLKAIPIDGYEIISKAVTRAGISAKKVDVKISGHAHRHETRWRDIEELIGISTLAPHIKERGLAIFRVLFEAEAFVHGHSFDEVHLHELGGTDCIVDIFGTVIGLDMLGIGEIFVSPVNLGSGTVNTSHGILPVPAPATAELLKGYPVYSTDTGFELTTPTGAAILKGLNAQPCAMPVMSIDAIGYGAGGKDIDRAPNVLRLMTGNAVRSTDNNRVTVIEANIDDMNPQLYENVFDRLLSAGALDVYIENIIMKKGRPAQKLTVIADRHIKELSEIIFRETSTIGLRTHASDRITLQREVTTVNTRFGTVRVKTALLNGEAVNVAAEYEDIKAIAAKTGLPIKKVAEAVSIDICSTRRE